MQVSQKRRAGEILQPVFTTDMQHIQPVMQLIRGHQLALDIMGNAMTGTARWVLFMNLAAVRLTVTTLTLWYLAVGRMTLGTFHNRMPCHPILQKVVGVLMATGADIAVLVLRITDGERGMNRMAGHAVRDGKLNQGAVIFMALTAFRNPAVLLGMA